MYVYTNACAKIDVFFKRFGFSEALLCKICSEKDFVFA